MSSAAVGRKKNLVQDSSNNKLFIIKFGNGLDRKEFFHALHKYGTAERSKQTNTQHFHFIQLEMKDQECFKTVAIVGKVFKRKGDSSSFFTHFISVISSSV